MCCGFVRLTYDYAFTLVPDHKCPPIETQKPRKVLSKDSNPNTVVYRSIYCNKNAVLNNVCYLVEAALWPSWTQKLRWERGHKMLDILRVKSSKSFIFPAIDGVASLWSAC